MSSSSSVMWNPLNRFVPVSASLHGHGGDGYGHGHGSDRRLFFGDDVSFEDHIPETVDTSSWALAFTLISCALILMMLPIAVVLGERYEQRRISEEENAEALFVKEDEEMAAAVDVDPPSKAARRRAKKAKKNENGETTPGPLNAPLVGETEDGKRRTSGVNFRLPPPSEQSHRRRRSKSSRMTGGGGGGDNNSVMTGMTGASRMSKASSYVHGRSVARSDTSGSVQWRKIVDKVVMPPYQDDEEKSILSRGDSRMIMPDFGDNRSVAGSVVSARSRMSHASAVSGTSSIFDASNRRRQGRVLTHSTPSTRAHRLQRVAQQEDGTQDTHSVASHTLQRRKRQDISDTKSEGGRSYNSRHSRRSFGGRSAGGRYYNTGTGSVSGYSNRNDDDETQSYAPSMMSKIVDDISPNDAADANDPGQVGPEMDADLQLAQLSICCGKNALWRPAIILRGLDNLVDIAAPDNESRRLVKLGIPYTLAVVMDAVFENVELALIGNFIGTSSLAAYALSETLIGTTEEFVGGIYDAAMTVVPHAIGAGNNYLVGQYVQMTVVFYLVVNSAPTVFWWFYIKPIVRWFGMPEAICELSEVYTRIVLFTGIPDAFKEIVDGLLEVTDHEAFAAVFGIVEGLVYITVLSFMFFFYDLTLIDLVWINFGLSMVFFFIMCAIIWYFGWFRAFSDGMFKNIAFRNTPAFKNLMNLSIPLALGALLAYAEWEILTVFAAWMGDAEVAAWTVLGDIWETFEAATEGIADAGEVRVAFHLGKGNPEMAKMAAYKATLYGTIFGAFITSLFFIVGDDLPNWFTRDLTLRRMIRDCIPLIGIGNITMTFGMICWSIIGAQGRYRLATMVAFVCSWSVTMPLAAVMVYVFSFDLRAMTAAVVVGYLAAGTVMSYIMLRTDWARCSRIIQEINRETGETYSDDEEEGEYSSSSSSSSSASDDDDSDSDDSEDS